jgi:hypothetical protein
MSPSFRTITIPAGSATNPGIVTELVSGRYYATVSTTALFYVRPDQGSQIEQNQGRRFGGEDQEFSKLTFFNYNASALTVTYYAGPTEYVPDPSVVATIASLSVAVNSTISHAPSTPSASGILALADGVTSADITNASGKQITFQNLGTSTGALHVKDSAGNVGAVLQPGDPPFAQETPGTWKLTAVGGAVDYCWCKLIYT